jgi:hypothetical protein
MLEAMGSTPLLAMFTPSALSWWSLLLAVCKGDSRFGDYFSRYIKDKFDEPVVDGWKSLFNEADPTVEWNSNSLELVCKIAVNCMAASPLRRISTGELVQELSDVLKLDFLTSNGISPGNESSIADMGGEDTKKCVLCSRAVIKSVVCDQNNAHWTCFQCLEDLVFKQIGLSGKGIHCAIEGCKSGPFCDNAFYGTFPQAIYDLYVRERLRQNHLEELLSKMNDKLDQHHNFVVTSFASIAAGVERGLRAMAYWPLMTLRNALAWSGWYRRKGRIALVELPRSGSSGPVPRVWCSESTTFTLSVSIRLGLSSQRWRLKSHAVGLPKWPLF